MDSKLIKFYKNSGVPYSIEDIIGLWDDNSWEVYHDFIQWLFPTTKKSIYNVNAPILTIEDAKYLRINNVLLKSALNRFKLFLQRGNHLTHFNHNYLRITRVIESLCEIGLKTEAELFHKWFIKNNTANDTDLWHMEHALTITQYE